MVTPYLTFWGTAKLFSKVATPFAVLPTMYIGLCWWLSSAGDSNARDSSSIPRLGRSPGEGNGNPLQYSCPGRGAWQATVVHGVVRVGHDSMGLPQQCMNVLIFLHPHQHLSFIIWFFFFLLFFLILVILVDLKWHLLIALICISLLLTLSTVSCVYGSYLLLLFFKILFVTQRF